MEALTRLGIDLNAIAEKLQIDGISTFAADYDRVLAPIDKKTSMLWLLQSAARGIADVACRDRRQPNVHGVGFQPDESVCLRKLVLVM